MNAFNQEKFTKEDLKGLESLWCTLDCYGDLEVEREMYENLIWSLARCSDLETAQNKLDLVNFLIESYGELHDYNKEKMIGIDFMGIIEEIDTKLLEIIVPIIKEKLRGHRDRS